MAEHQNEKLSPISLNAIGAATRLGTDVSCLLAGDACDAVLIELAKIKPLKRILLAQHPALAGLLPGRFVHARLSMCACDPMRHSWLWY
ncbi:MAG: hypothetical protein GY832_13080 [Chloroflexi bacterium]|nr:hypothetical protein [Chloroflexota bacterium]